MAEPGTMRAKGKQKGGARPGAGRPRMHGEPARHRSLYCTEWELGAMRKLLARLRAGDRETTIGAAIE